MGQPDNDRGGRRPGSGRRSPTVRHGRACASASSIKAIRPFELPEEISALFGCRARAGRCRGMRAGAATRSSYGRPCQKELLELTDVDAGLQQPGGFWLGFSDADVEARAELLGQDRPRGR